MGCVFGFGRVQLQREYGADSGYAGSSEGYLAENGQYLSAISMVSDYTGRFEW